MLTELWNPKQGTGLGAAAALRRAQEYVRTLEQVVPDVEASKKQGRPVTKTVRPWAAPHYLAAWGLPD